MLHQHSTSELKLNLDSNDYTDINSLIHSPFSYTIISAYNNHLTTFPQRICNCIDLKVLN